MLTSFPHVVVGFGVCLEPNGRQCAGAQNDATRAVLCRSPKNRAYLTMTTTLGPLNIELRCDLAPRTCENFLALCEMGYYTGTPFHRSIRNFMVQGATRQAPGGAESRYTAPRLRTRWTRG